MRTYENFADAQAPAQMSEISGDEWFNSLENKSSCIFLAFDIVEFYPSITQKLFEI